MSSGGQMLRQAALQVPPGCSYRAIPVLGVTSIRPNPVRLASLTTVAEVPALAGRIWAWALAAMPAVATAEPLTRSVATIARAVQDRPPAGRRVNLINYTTQSAEGSSAISYHVRGLVPVHNGRQVTRCPPRGKGAARPGRAARGPRQEDPKRPQLSGKPRPLRGPVSSCWPGDRVPRRQPEASSVTTQAPPVRFTHRQKIQKLTRILIWGSSPGRSQRRVFRSR